MGAIKATLLQRLFDPGINVLNAPLFSELSSFISIPVDNRS